MARLFDDAATEHFVRTSGVVTAHPFSLSAWFMVDDLSAAGTIVALGEDAQNDYARLNVNTAGQFHAQHQGNNATVFELSATADSAVSTGTWYHGGGRFASTASVIAYFDGAAQTEGTDDIVEFTPDRTSIGYLVRKSPTQPLSGRIAEVAVWDVALNGTEFKMLAAGVSPLRVRPANLVAYWPLPAFTGDAIDYSGNGNTLTDTNTVGVADHAPVAPMFGYDRHSGLFVPAAGGSVVPPKMDYYRRMRVT